MRSNGGAQGSGMMYRANSGSQLCKCSKSVMGFCWHLKQQAKQIMNSSETLRLNYSPAFVWKQQFLFRTAGKQLQSLKYNNLKVAQKLAVVFTHRQS